MTSIFLIARSDPRAVYEQAVKAGITPLIFDTKETIWWQQLTTLQTPVYIYVEKVENESEVLLFLESIRGEQVWSYLSFPPLLPPLPPLPSSLLPPLLGRRKEETKLPMDLAPLLIAYSVGEGTNIWQIEEWAQEDPQTVRRAAKEILQSQILPSVEESLHLFEMLIWPGGIQKNVIIEAAGEGHLEIVKYLFDDSKDIDVRRRNEAAFTEAARKGRLNVVQYLVEERKMDSFVLESGPFLAAVSGGHLDVVRYLVSKGANPHSHVVRLYGRVRDPHSRGDWPFVRAIEEGRLNIVRYLVEEQGVNIFAREGYLRKALGGRHLGVIMYLLEKGLGIGERDSLILAIRYGHLKAVQYLVEKGIDLKTYGREALLEATERKNLDILQYLVEEGVDLKAHGGDALLLALKEGHTDIFRYLVEEGVGINEDVLKEAIMGGKLPMVKYIIEERKFEVQKDKRQLVHWAIMGGDLEVFKYFFGADIDPEETMEFAVMYQRRSITEYLKTSFGIKGGDYTSDEEQEFEEQDQYRD